MKKSFTNNPDRKQSHRKMMLSLLLVDSDGKGDAFKTIPTLEATYDHVKRMVGCTNIQIYPFQLLFKNKVYDIACNADGMNERSLAVFTPHDMGMIADENKVEFVMNDNSGRLANLHVLKEYGVSTVDLLTGEFDGGRKSNESLTGTTWAFHHYGPLVFIEANTGWEKRRIKGWRLNRR